MKRIAYSFLLIALLSCGSSRQDDHRIQIAFRDSTTGDYSLLAVRSDALVVESFLTGSSPEAIPFVKIEMVYNPGIQTLPTALAGCGFGFAGSYAAASTSHSWEGLVPFVIGAPLAMIGGGILGCTLAKSLGEYDVSKVSEQTRLVKHSMYPYGEPPELEKIK